MKKLALVLFTLALMCGMAELTLRLFPKLFVFFPAPEDYVPHVFVEDPAITWTLKPNARVTHHHLFGDFQVIVSTDSHGFRPNGYDVNRPDILILGDSYAFGFGVNDGETFPAYLAKLLPSFNVLNAGYTSGMSLDTQYVWFMNHYAEFKPRLVIIQFFSGNDFGDMDRNSWVTNSAGLPERVITPFRASRKDNTLVFSRKGIANLAPILKRHSHLCAFLADRLDTLMKAIDRRRHGLVEYGNPETIARIDRLMDAWKEHANRNGYPLLFVFVPTTYDDTTRYVVRRAEGAVKDHLRAIGVDFMDLDFLYQMPRESIHFAHDGHFTAYANECVATQMFDYLVRQYPGLIDRKISDKL